MRRTRLASLAGAPCMIALAATAASAQPVSGPYVSLGAGANFLQNEYLNPEHDGIYTGKRSYRFDVGPAGYVAAGIGLPFGFRVEAEGDYAYNHVRGVGYVVPERAGGYQQQYGGFANLIKDFDLGLPVVPYLGGGVGYQVLEIDHINSSVAAVAGRSDPIYERNGSFAYQGIAGVSYPMPFLPGLAATAEYRMIGMTSPDPYFRGFANDGASTFSKVRNTFNHEAMIGLRFAFGAPPPPPPSFAPPAQEPPPVAQTRTYLVFFDWDRAELTGRARQIIAEAATTSTRMQTTRIEVDGYTDLSGTATYNQGLSVRRADSVASELVRDGVQRSEISVQGFGESHPLVPTAQGVREPQNRRVEIVLK